MPQHLSLHTPSLVQVVKSPGGLQLQTSCTTQLPVQRRDSYPERGDVSINFCSVSEATESRGWHR